MFTENKKTICLTMIIMALTVAGFFAVPASAQNCENPPKEEGLFKTHTGSLVPCGRKCDDSSTTDVNESEPCTICHLLVMISRIFNVLLALVGSVAILLILLSGVFYITSVSSPGLRSQAEAILSKALLGLFLFLASWLIVATVLKFISVKTSVLGSGGKWYQFTCDTGSGSGSGSSGGLTVEPADIAFSSGGQTQQLKVSSGGKDVTEESKYASDDSATATVSAEGLVTNAADVSQEGFEAKETKIKATYQDKEGSASVMVASATCPLDILEGEKKAMPTAGIIKPVHAAEANSMQITVNPKTISLDELKSLTQSGQGGGKRKVIEICVHKPDKISGVKQVVLSYRDPDTNKDIYFYSPKVAYLDTSNKILAGFVYEEKMKATQYDLWIQTEGQSDFYYFAKSITMTESNSGGDCTIVYGTENAPFAVFFSRVNSITTKSGSTGPCDQEHQQWDESDESQRKEYENMVAAAVQQMGLLGNAKDKFVIYRWNKVAEKEDGSTVCSEVKTAKGSTYIYKSHAWVERGKGVKAYAIRDGGDSYFCNTNDSLGQTNAFIHEQGGHCFGMLNDEYDENDAPGYCEKLKGKNCYTCTINNQCQKWQSVAQTACLPGCISLSFYRSTDNSVMRDHFEASATFSELQKYILNTIASDYNKRKDNLKFLEEVISCP